MKFSHCWANRKTAEKTYSATVLIGRFGVRAIEPETVKAPSNYFHQESQTNNDQYKICIGELLVQVGLLTEKALLESLASASITGMQIGRVLVLNGLITNLDLTNALTCQFLLEGFEITLDSAEKAMQLAHDQALCLMDAIAWIDRTSFAPYQQKTDLADLLLAANYITKIQMEETFAELPNHGLPFGRALVAGGNLPESLLSAAINVRIMIRDNELTEDQGIQLLKELRRKQLPLEDLLPKYAVVKESASKKLLGEILVSLGHITNNQLYVALEQGLASSKQIGEVLLQSGLITELILEDALATQDEKVEV